MRHPHWGLGLNPSRLDVLVDTVLNAEPPASGLRECPYLSGMSIGSDGLCQI
jgi:hypothetical protein